MPQSQEVVCSSTGLDSNLGVCKLSNNAGTDFSGAHCYRLWVRPIELRITRCSSGNLKQHQCISTGRTARSEQIRTLLLHEGRTHAPGRQDQKWVWRIWHCATMGEASTSVSDRSQANRKKPQKPRRSEKTYQTRRKDRVSATRTENAGKNEFAKNE